MSRQEERSTYPIMSADYNMVVGAAIQLSARMGLGYTGTEHALMVLCAPNSPGREAITRLGVDPNEVVRQITIATGQSPASPKRPPKDVQGVVVTQGLRTAMSHSISEALRTRSAEVTLDHLLAGLIRQGEGYAAGILAENGLTEETLRERREALEDSTGTPA